MVDEAVKILVRIQGVTFPSCSPACLLLWSSRADSMFNGRARSDWSLQIPTSGGLHVPVHRSSSDTHHTSSHGQIQPNSSRHQGVCQRQQGHLTNCNLQIARQDGCISATTARSFCSVHCAHTHTHAEPRRAGQRGREGGSMSWTGAESRDVMTTSQILV